MDDLTSILSEIGQRPNAPGVSDRLLELVYDELRQMAARKLRREAPGQTLQATALVHEAWLRLLDSLSSEEEVGEAWQNRQHFFGAAAEAMRRILIEKARFKKRLKRGGPNAKRQELNEAHQTTNPVEDDVLDLHSALEAFEKIDSTKAQIVKLKFFVGLTTNEIAETTRLSVATVERYWVYARAWLYQKMSEKDSHE